MQWPIKTPDWQEIKYLFDSLNCKSIYNFLKCIFLNFSVFHCSNIPTIKIIDW